MSEKCRPTPKLFNTEPNHIDLIKARVAWEVTRLMPLTVEGIENRTSIVAHAKAGKPFLAIANHTSMIDAFMLIRVMQYMSGQQFDQIAFPASQKLFDGRMAKEGKIIRALQKLRQGLHFYPMVQTRDELSTHDFSTGKKNMYAIQKLRAILQRSKPKAPNLVGYFLEGGRSMDGTLQPAEEGISHLLKKDDLAQQAMIVPVALVGMAKIYDTKPHIDTIFAREAKVIVGVPFFHTDAQQVSSQYNIDPGHIYMLKIASLLPDSMLGWYDKPFFRRILDHLSKKRSFPSEGIIYQPKP